MDDQPMGSTQIIDNNVTEITDKCGPWNPKSKAFFIALLDEKVKTFVSRQTRTFTKQAWARIKDKMIHKTKYNYTLDQLKNKYNQLQQLLTKFKALIKETRVGWDSTKHTITTKPEVWERLFKVNKFARKFKKKGFQHYHELCRIFGDTSATGVHVHPSTRAPSSSTDSFDPAYKPDQNEDLDALESDVAKAAWGKHAATTSTKVKGRKRNTSSTNLEAVIQAWSVNSKRKYDLLEKKLATKDSVPISANDSVASVGDSCTLVKCMEVLNSMEDLDGPVYSKSLKVLHDQPSWREIFLAMPEKRKRD